MAHFSEHIPFICTMRLKSQILTSKSNINYPPIIVVYIFSPRQLSFFPSQQSSFLCILVELLKFVLHITKFVSCCQFAPSLPLLGILILLLNCWLLCSTSLSLLALWSYQPAAFCISTGSLLKPFCSYFIGSLLLAFY